MTSQLIRRYSCLRCWSLNFKIMISCNRPKWVRSHLAEAWKDAVLTRQWPHPAKWNREAVLDHSSLPVRTSHPAVATITMCRVQGFSNNRPKVRVVTLKTFWTTNRYNNRLRKVGSQAQMDSLLLGSKTHRIRMSSKINKKVHFLLVDNRIHCLHLLTPRCHKFHPRNNKLVLTLQTVIN